jgi:hypothetical protein
MILFVSSSLFSFTWDVYMDWGLGRPKYGFLGESLMYPKRYYYYVIIAVDLGTCYDSLPRDFAFVPLSHRRCSFEIHVGAHAPPSFVGGAV